jgi:hypothetical protein
LSTDSSTNWVPGWRPFHNNLPVFSSQAEFQLNSSQQLTRCFRLSHLQYLGKDHKHRSSIVVLGPVTTEICLPNRSLQMGCLTPLFCCYVHHLATAAIYRVTA